MDLSSLSLFVATPTQTVVSRRRTGKSPWGKGMTLDEYLERDTKLETSECGKNGRFMTWVLAPADNPETPDFLCSCETFRRTGLIMRKDSFTEEEVECYGIASVFTPPEHRKKGYARRMMSLLHWILAGRVTPPIASFPKSWGNQPCIVPGMGKAAFSALWSDVGNFYELCNPDDSERHRNGWMIRGGLSTVWHAETGFPDLNTEENASDEWRWLDDKAVRQLCSEDSERIRREMKVTSPFEVSFTFLPSAGIEAFQRERLERFWENENVSRWGVFHGQTTSDAAAAYATWTLEIRPPAPRTLVVTRLRASENNLAGVLGRIFETAKKYRIDTVEIWNVPSHLKSGVTMLGGTEYERKEHLPAFKWYGNEHPSQVEWLHNEKFCWC